MLFAIFYINYIIFVVALSLKKIKATNIFLTNSNCPHG